MSLNNSYQRRNHSKQQQQQRNRQIEHQIANNFIYGRKQQQSQHNNGSDRRTYHQNANYVSSVGHISSSAHYETITIDVNGDLSITESVLCKHFTTYGAIKKLWFNCDRSKAFISFYDVLSVNMIMESSGHNNTHTINGEPIRVSPLKVAIPEQLKQCSSNRHSVKPIDVRSVNLSLSANFPISDRSNISGSSSVRSECSGESYNDTSLTPITRRQLFHDLVQSIQIDNSKLLEQILKAEDVSKQIELFCETVALNEDDQQNRIKIKNKLQELLHENGFHCEFYFLGSTVNKLGFRDSDIDFYIELNPSSDSNDKQQQRYDFDTAISYLERIKRILKRQLNMFVPKPIASMRCPIVRLDFKFMSDDLEQTGIVCDLSLSNRLGVHNSKLISYFCDVEPRFRSLSLVLRYWAKMNAFIGSQEFSSYAFTMLCVFFAQNTSPPLLPSIECLMNAANHSKIIDGWECGFSDDNNAWFTTNEKNTETVYELIANFFKFYSQFDFTTQVICPKTGQSVHKSVFMRQNVFNFSDTDNTNNTLSFKMTPFCCIQDPFDLRHNITLQCRHNVFYKFCEFVHYIASNNETVFATKQNIGVYWGIAQLITEFDRNSTCGYVYPQYMIGYPSIELILNETKSGDNCSGNSLNDIMLMMANGLSQLVLTTLCDVYKVECDLVGKWDVVMNELSPFAEYIVKFRGLDFEVINSLTRQSVMQTDLSESERQMDYFAREKLITDRIVDRHNTADMNDTQYDIIPIRCHFVLVFNPRYTSPSIELEMVEVKPSLEFASGVIDFIKKALITAANQQNLLTVNKDLLLTKTVLKEITIKE